ncbi:MAG TPA: hypothetical protein PKJ56_03790, partial [Promineifilum sp.]|nr:hypothetical protein [Promineifilum sp.]
MAELLPLSRNAVAQLSASLDEPEWMLDLRLQAWDIYESLPVPSTSDEAWRRTDIRRFKLGSVGVSLNGDNGVADTPAPSYLGEQ